MKTITVETKGDFHNLFNFLESAKGVIKMSTLDKYGRLGVQALRDATPVDSGETANSWFYKIDRTKNGYSISWHNDNVVDGANIAILLQYGHATRKGTWVEGVDYINPALKPIFDELAQECWSEVTHK